MLGPPLPPLSSAASPLASTRPTPSPIGHPDATPGTDASRLNLEPRDLVLSPRQAAALAVMVVLLVALSFVAGFLVAATR